MSTKPPWPSDKPRKLRLAYKRVPKPAITQAICDRWPEDANELTTRLHGWFSRNLWLVEDTAGE